MQIRMTEERTGPRWDNQAWPPVGGTIYVSDEEGRGICAAGWAVPVADEQRAETPEDSLSASEEQRDTPAAPASGSPAVNDPKSAWVAHAINKGTAPADAEAMTKQQLIDHYGS